MSYAPLAQTRAQNDKAAADAVKNKGLPLLTERTMSFTTSEATWLSLDLSPDGKTIVFELLGRSLHPADHRRRGDAHHQRPGRTTCSRRSRPTARSWSFISDRNGSENVWVANADGTKPRAITTTERENYMSPTWAPDGEYVIAAKGAQLWMYHESGGCGVQMTGVSSGTRPAGRRRRCRGTGDPRPRVRQGPAVAIVGERPRQRARGIRPRAWSPTSRRPTTIRTPLAQLARASSVPIRSRSSIARPAACSSARTSTKARSARSRARTASGSSTRPATTRAQALKLIDLSTGEDRWLTMDVQRDDSQGGGARDRDVYPKSAFTPDSKSLITSYDGKLWRVAVPAGEAVEIPFTAKVDQQLGPLVKFDYPIDDEKLKVSQIRGARPSPDGKRVVFTALDRLWIADLPQGRGTKKEKPAGAGGDADEKPDADAATSRGRQAGCRRAEAGRRAAAKPAAEAPPAPCATIRNARRLTTGTDVEHGPVWSPDGQFIAYVTWNDDDGGRIYRVRADGSGQPERLTPVAAFYDKLAYSRDGSRLIGGARIEDAPPAHAGGFRQSQRLRGAGVRLAAGGGRHGLAHRMGGRRVDAAGARGAARRARSEPHLRLGRIRRTAVDALRRHRRQADRQGHGAGAAAAAGRAAGPPPTPDEVILSPDGKRALVRANRNVYMITVPPVGRQRRRRSRPPRHRRCRRGALTKVGGDFIGWTADSQAAYFSIGRSFFLHDIALAGGGGRGEPRQGRDRGRARRGRAVHREAAGPTDAAADKPATQKPPAPPKIPTLEYEPHRVDVEIVVDKDKPKGIDRAAQRARSSR